MDPETVLRLAGAIALETLALCVWNIGTRPPLTMLKDVTSALRSPRALASGAFTVLVGIVFVAAATVLLLPTVDDLGNDLVPLVIYTFVTALALEFLIGNDLRGAIGRLGAARRSA